MDKSFKKLASGQRRGVLNALNVARSCCFHTEQNTPVYTNDDFVSLYCFIAALVNK